MLLSPVCSTTITPPEQFAALIKEEIPEVREILDVTDHGSGRNPYYSPSKG